MSFFSRLFGANRRAAEAVRRVRLTPAVLRSGVAAELEPLMNRGGLIRCGDGGYLTTTTREVEQIARKAWEPWVPETGDCDKQALAVKHEANRHAAELGLKETLAVGFLWTAGRNPHAYTVACVGHETGGFSVKFYDQTEAAWVPVGELDQPVTLVIF